MIGSPTADVNPPVIGSPTADVNPPVIGSSICDDSCSPFTHDNCVQDVNK